MNFVYILRCSDNTLYTGWTNDLIKGLKSHNSGRLPAEVVYFEIYDNPIDAL